MTKLLNVDILSSDERTLVLGGEEHAVIEMSVENFLETTKAAEELQDSDASLSAQVEKAVELILRSVPTAPRALLVKTPLRHLQTIVAFVRGDDIKEEAVDAAAAADEAAKGKKPAPKARARK